MAICQILIAAKERYFLPKKNAKVSNFDPRLKINAKQKQSKKTNKKNMKK
jgi:hypothetical protein